MCARLAVGCGVDAAWYYVTKVRDTGSIDNRVHSHLLCLHHMCAYVNRCMQHHCRPTQHHCRSGCLSSQHNTLCRTRTSFPLIGGRLPSWLYRWSFSWASINERFSSTTRTRSTPSAHSEIRVGSKGHTCAGTRGQMHHVRQHITVVWHGGHASCIEQEHTIAHQAAHQLGSVVWPS